MLIYIYLDPNPRHRPNRRGLQMSVRIRFAVEMEGEQSVVVHVVRKLVPAVEASLLFWILDAEYEIDSQDRV